MIAVETLANHRLHCYSTGLIPAWWLKADGTGLNALLVSVLPTGLVISGDLDRPFATRSPRYGIRWFVSVLGPRYLAEKFLSKEWVPEVARHHVEREVLPLVEAGELGTIEDATAIREAMGDGAYESADAFARAFGDIEGLGFDEPPYDYDPAAVGWLAAIQGRFRALFWERYARIEDDGTLVPRSEMLTAPAPNGPPS